MSNDGGTLFDAEALEQGDWFPFFESRYDFTTGETVYDLPKEGAAEFRIRSLTEFYVDRRKGRKREYKMVFNPTSRSMERVGYYPDLSPEEEAAERDDSYDYAITGIRNAFWGEDRPIECDRESKIKLMKNPAFSRYFMRVLEMLANSGAKTKEEAEKNS